MKIILEECVTPSEGEIHRIGKEKGLDEDQITNMWTTIREIPVVIVYDTLSESFTIKEE